MLREVGLAVEYWMPKLQEHLSVTYVQALLYLKEKDLQKLKSHIQHPWEKMALEKMFDLLHSNSTSELQKSLLDITKKRQKQAEEALQNLKDLLSEGRQRKEKTVRRK
jgi:hypothetical protein